MFHHESMIEIEILWREMVFIFYNSILLRFQFWFVSGKISFYQMVLCLVLMFIAFDLHKNYEYCIVIFYDCSILRFHCFSSVDFVLKHYIQQIYSNMKKETTYVGLLLYLTWSVMLLLHAIISQKVYYYRISYCFLFVAVHWLIYLPKELSWVELKRWTDSIIKKENVKMPLLGSLYEQIVKQLKMVNHPDSENAQGHFTCSF